ncbi:MAG: tetratricopeptide (TPR) repeat protein, partial [Patiriisocius sp.]
MNKRNTNIIFRLRTLGAFLVLVFLSTSINAQIKKGDKMFNKFEYEKALTAYEIEYNDNATANPYLTRRIGMTYRHLGDIESSAIWFKRTLDLDQSNKLDYLYYAESLKYLKEYDKSMEYYQLYASLDPNDHRANEHLLNPNYYQQLLSDTLQFTVKRLKMNNENAAFGITKYKDQYLFSSTGAPNPEVTQNYNVFDVNPYLDIFSANRMEDAEFVDVERVKGEVNSKFHDGPIAFDESRSQLYVTRNNVKRGRATKDNTGRVNLKVYVFDELEGGEWSEGTD